MIKVGGLCTLLGGKKEWGEKASMGKKKKKKTNQSFHKTNGFSREQMGNKVCHVFVYARVSSISILFMAMKLPQRGDLW